MGIEIIAAVLMFAGGGLLILDWMRSKDPAFEDNAPRPSLNINSRIQRELRRAGMRNTTPNTFLLIVSGIAAMVYATSALMLSVFAAFFTVPIVFAGSYMFVTTRQRSYLKRAGDEMVPMLRKIQASVRTGGNAQSAFINAVEETNLIGPAIDPIITRMKLNAAPFVELLGESREHLPFRIWSTFVRSMEMYNEVGGQLDKTLDDTVKQVQTMIRLRATARRYYQPMKSQQYFMVGVAASTAPLSIIFMGGTFLRMFESFLGLVVFFIGLAIMIFGLFIARRIIASVENRIGD